MVSVGRLYGGGRRRRRRRRGVVTLIPSWQLVRLAPVQPMKLPTRRKEEIVRAYVLATRGHLPTGSLEQLLADMRELMGDLTESEVRCSLAWALRRSRRQGALLERKLLGSADRSGLGWYGLDDDAVEFAC